MKKMLKNQHRPTKPCPCGRGHYYTDNGPGVPKINGKSVCEDCMVDFLYEQFHKQRGDNDED